MADLMAADGEERSRGQIILVTGFALAVAFVGLALVLNSVIYTENLATRSEAAKASDAAKVHIDMVNGTERIINYANTNNNSSYARLRANATASMDSMGELTTQLQATSAQAVSVELVEQYNGTRIEQTGNSRDYTSDSGNTNWTQIDDIGDVDRIELGLGNMSDPPDPALLALDTDAESQFEFVAEDEDGDQWVLRVSNKSQDVTSFSQNPHEFDIFVHTPANTYDLGTYSNNSVVNVTNGSINGNDVSNLNFGEDIDPVEQVEFGWGGNMTAGNYTMFVQNETDGDDDLLLTNYDTSGGSPSFQPQIYNATVNIEYEEGRMTYATNVTRGPGT